MKKLMFAFACAASVAAFAADYNLTGFEDLDAGTTGISAYNDAGAAYGSVKEGFFFAYKPASGSTDGSTVKAYGVGDNLPAFDYTKLVPAAFAAEGLTQLKYLELSTEGGTLWRGVSETDHSGETPALGGAIDLDPENPNDNIYVDTLVQFTPTEDGTAPAVEPADQMAIWLNVDSTDPDAPVTNLCVLAARCDDVGTSLKTTFVAPNKAQGGIDIVPGQWYRLTVKAYGDITNGDSIPGFVVYIDGKPLKTGTTGLTENYIELLGEDMAVSVADMLNGSVFCSLWTLEEEGAGDPYAPTFSGVGFKGSGAIDDLVLSTDVPNFFGAVTSVDFTLNWTANFSAVSYTIDGTKTDLTVDEKAAGTTTVKVEPGKTVTVAATAADWYTVTGTTGDIKVDEATEVSLEAALAATPGAAGVETLPDVSTADAMAWAKDKKLTLDAIKGCKFAQDAYLMNTADLTNQPGLQVTAIEETEGGWNITVKGTQGDKDVTLEGIRGVLKIKAAATLADLAKAAAETASEFTLDDQGKATIKVSGNTKNFMKAVVGMPAAK